MNSTAESWVVRLLTGLARAVIRHPGWFVVPQLVLFAVCVWVTVDRLQFDMDRNNLVGTDQRYHQAFMKYLVEFDAGMDLVAVVESESREKNRQFVERLGARMQAEPELFTNVFFKGDLKLMGPKALLLVTNASVLVEMDQRLVAARPMLESFSQVTNLVSLFKLVNRQ
ncbi:MAG: MMPL family transporter, partial [Limisphaerales bacterium]